MIADFNECAEVWSDSLGREGWIGEMDKARIGGIKLRLCRLPKVKR